MPRLSFVRASAGRFMPGERLEDAIRAAQELAGHGIGSVLTHLGENVADEGAADAATAGYLDTIDRIAGTSADVEISVKPTQLGLDVGPAVAMQNLSTLVGRAAERGAYVWVDTESSAYLDATLELYRRVRSRHAEVGVCLQAHLHRTAADAEALLALRSGIRLVKGAYRESPVVAFQKKSDIDANFASVAAMLLTRGRDAGARIALASHDVELLAMVEDQVGRAGLARGGYEIQMLYGIRTPDQLRLAAAGHSLRVLIAYGTSWYPWYVRRLAERPANVWFVVNAVRRPRQALHPSP